MNHNGSILNSMEKISYKMTWCEYLTPCKYRKGIMVGEYDCYQCPFFKKDINYSVYCSCKQDTKIKHTAIKLALAIRRILWFFNGRLARHLYIRRDIRKFWQFIMWTTVIFLFIRFVMFPFFGWWDKVILGMNHVIWG